MLTENTQTGGASQWRALLVTRIAKLRLSGNRIFILLAVVIGVLTGLAVVAFILVSERLGTRLYPAGGAPWRRAFFPIAGSLFIGYLIFRFFPEARGSGIPQTKAALFARDGYISLRTVLGKFFCTSATIASGIPLGREGPSVQVGAGIGSILGRLLRLRPDQVRGLIPVGAAAAVAAAFNTPLAAVIFALEEIMGDLHAPVMGAVVVASATAWLTLRLCLGNHPLFTVPSYQLVSSAEFAVYAVLGIAGGIVAVAFTSLLLKIRGSLLRLPPHTRWAQPLIGGVLVGLIALFVPQVLGVGYSIVGQALNNSLAVRLMLLLIVLKLIAVAVSFASGNAGGIFGPALFMGAMTGGLVGTVAHHFFPAATANPGAYALVGMGCVFAGVIRAPMTSVLMIFELTQDYAVIVPLMIANMISLFIASRIQHEPIYEAIAIQDGIHLPSAKSRQTTQRRVLAVMQPASQAPACQLSASLTVGQALASAPSGPTHTWLLSGPGGVIGVMTLARLQQEPPESSETPLSALIDPLAFPHVHADQGLDLALERMGANHLDLLPVVNRANIHNLEGILTLKAVLNAYGVTAD